MKLPAKTVADAWLDVHCRKLSKTERSLGMWVDEALALAVTHDPDYALEIILGINQSDLPNHKRAILAAGPLEDLIAYQGVVTIDKIEAEAKRDPSFASLLGGVWQSAAVDDVWKRIEACRNFEGWD